MEPQIVAKLKIHQQAWEIQSGNVHEANQEIKGELCQVCESISEDWNIHDQKN